MRLICTIDPEKAGENPVEFSYYLLGQGIENECEKVANETKSHYRIWVYDEDLVEKANDYYLQYQKNPQDPIFRTSFQKIVEMTPIDEIPPEGMEELPPEKKRILSSTPYGVISLCTLISVILLFFWGQLTRTQIVPPNIPEVIAAPVLSPLERTLVFDYPRYFVLRDELLTLYTPKDIEEKKAPSEAATALLQKMQLTPTWMGIYDPIIFRLQNKPVPLNYQGPLFSDIREGQIWRLFTPALLHFDLLHIFFNILWFILLGNQIEYRIGTIRFLGLMLVVGVLANVAQYLMSGPFFMGLSGIVCGMAGFIFARQQIAPWEGYLLHRFTLLFLGVFVVGMFILSLAFFALQVWSTFTLSIGIANTAHIVGGLTGYLLGRLKRLFAIRSLV